MHPQTPDLTQLKASITALTTAFHEFKLTQDLCHASYLASFQTIQAQILSRQPPTSPPPPPLQSDNSEVDTLPLAPILPTIADANHRVVLDNLSIPEIRERSKELVTGTMNVAEMSVTVSDGVLQRREAIVSEMSKLNQSTHPLRISLLRIPKVLAPTNLCSATIDLSSPPSSELSYEPSRGVTTTFALTDACSFGFDPGGTTSDVRHSTVRRLVHSRKLPSEHRRISISVPLQWSPPRVPVTPEPPPWVPWRLETQNMFRVPFSLSP